MSASTIAGMIATTIAMTATIAIPIATAAIIIATTYVRHYRPVYYTDYRHRLYAPPRGYHWVRADDDALLIGVTSGIVSAIVSNAFYR